MPKTINLQDVYMHTITLGFNPIPGKEAVTGFNIRYSILDEAGVPHGGGVYFHELTPAQKTQFKKILMDTIAPIIKEQEGI